MQTRNNKEICTNTHTSKSFLGAAPGVKPYVFLREQQPHLSQTSDLLVLSGESSTILEILLEEISIY